MSVHLACASACQEEFAERAGVREQAQQQMLWSCLFAGQGGDVQAEREVLHSAVHCCEKSIQ